MSKIKLDDTLEFYRGILTDVNITLDDDDNAVFVFGEGDSVPATVDERQLFLPTRQRLKSIDPAHSVAFHPLCQNVLRGDSQVLKALKKYVTISLSTRIHLAMIHLGELAIQTELHEHLQPRQAAFLQKVTDYKKRTHVTTKQLIKAANFEDRDRALVSTYIRKGGEVGNRKWSQACIVNYPMRQSLDAEGVTVGDVKFYSHKDKEAVKALFDYILPDHTKYSQGSNSSVAPNLDALLKSFHKIAKQLNKIFDRFEDVIPQFEAAKYDLEWWDAREYLKEMSLTIPALEGNDGEVPRGLESEEADAMRRAATVSTGSPAPQAPQAPVTQPTHQPIGVTQPNTPYAAPEPPAESDSDSHGVEWNAQPTPPPQPYGYPPQQPAGYPPQQPYGYPQQPYGYPPQQPPQYPPQQPPAGGVPWGGQPNTGYVGRAQRGAAPTSPWGQTPQTQAPWVTSQAPGGYGWQ